MCGIGLYLKFILTRGIALGYLDLEVSASLDSSFGAVLVCSGSAYCVVVFAAMPFSAGLPSTLGLFGDVVDLSELDGCSFF